MALNGLLDIDLAVKNPQELCEFWERRGLNSPTAGVLGTDDRKKQITVIHCVLIKSLTNSFEYQFLVFPP